MINVACAIIEARDKDGTLKVLVARRGPGMHLAGKWEFPGGKLHKGESAEDALLREIREELGMQIEILSALPPCPHTYPDKAIRLIPYICSATSMNTTPHEHDEIRWLEPTELSGLDFAEADIPVLGEYLRRHQRS